MASFSPFSRAWVLAHLVLLGCQDAKPQPDNPDGGGLASLLEADGFTTQVGRFAFVDLTDCCDLATCFGNNPSSPYAFVYVPPAPGQSVANPSTDADGMSAAWRLAQDEAIVYVGKTPPRAKYFGFTPSVYDRATPDGRRVVFSSIGDSVNNTTIDATEPFESEIAIVVAANSTTRQRVRDALVRSGIRDEAINTVDVSTNLVHLGACSS